MDQQVENSSQAAAVCIIQQDPVSQKILDNLLAYLDSPILSFTSTEQFLDRCSTINIGCILIDGDELGDKSQHFIDDLSSLGLTGATIIMARQANIDNAVKALKSGIADYLETPLPDRLLLAKIRQVMGDFRSVPAGQKC